MIEQRASRPSYIAYISGSLSNLHWSLLFLTHTQLMSLSYGIPCETRAVGASEPQYRRWWQAAWMDGFWVRVVLHIDGLPQTCGNHSAFAVEFSLQSSQCMHNRFHTFVRIGHWAYLYVFIHSNMYIPIICLHTHTHTPTHTHTNTNTHIIYMNIG